MFCLLALSSLKLTTVANGALASLFGPMVGLSPRALGETCVFSALVIGVIFWCTRRHLRVVTPAADAWRRTITWAVGWLACWYTAEACWAWWQNAWPRYADTLPTVLGFVVFGPLGEELLFRGSLLGLLDALFPSWPLLAVTASAGLFALHHLQLHPALDAGAWLQVAYTFPMGMVLGAVRHRSGRLWPGWVVHVLINIPAVSL